jgi:hypothetical protein
MEEAATPASEAIHGVLKAASVRDRALLVLFALEGLTVHEVEALRRADVHLNESPRMHVRCGGRGEAPRDLALDPYVAKCLADHLAAMPWKEQDDPVFLGGQGKPLTARQMQRICRSLCEDAGVRPKTPSDLRSGWILGKLGQGMLPGKIAEHLGLRSLSFVQSADWSFRRPPSRPARPRRRAGRPRRQEERDALLVELKGRQHEDGKPWSYKDVADEYERQRPDEARLKRDAVIKAVKRWSQRHPTESDATNGE